MKYLLEFLAFVYRVCNFITITAIINVAISQQDEKTMLCTYIYCCAVVVVY
jgi:hypothetical protein